MEHQNEMNDPDAAMSPKAVHAWLSWVLYWRRCRVDPLFNMLLVAGIANGEPFLGTVNMRGVAYPQKYVATGLAAMLIQQTLENIYRGAEKDGKPEMDKETAINTMKECSKLQFYHDCLASDDVEAVTIDSTGVNVVQLPSAEVTGNWEEVASHIVGYD